MPLPTVEEATPEQTVYTWGYHAAICQVEHGDPRGGYGITPEEKQLVEAHREAFLRGAEAGLRMVRSYRLVSTN